MKLTCASLPAICLLAGLALVSAAAAPATPKPKRPGRLAKLLASRPVVNEELTPERAVAIAWRESPVLRGAAEEARADVARLRQARAARYPWLSLQSLYSGGSQARMFTFGAPTRPSAMRAVPAGAFFEQALALIYPLYTGGRLNALVDRARLMRKASAAQTEAVRQEVALLVRVAYREVEARRSYVQVYRALLQENEERQRIDTVAFEQERIPRYYLLRDAAEVADSRQSLTNAQRDLDVAWVRLKTVMGINLKSDLRLAAQDEPAAHEKAATARPPELDASLAIAERLRPELQAAGYRVRAGDKSVRAARARFQPQINVGAVGNYFRAGGTDLRAGTTFGVIATFPVFDGSARAAAVSEARATRRRRAAEREQVALRVAEQVNTALLNLRAARQNLTTASQTLESAREDYRVVRLRVASGRGINLEALDALAAQVRAENNVVQARFEHQVAQDRLLYATGQLAESIPSSIRKQPPQRKSKQ